MHRQNDILKTRIMQPEQPDLDKQFDALIAQLTRQRRPRRRLLIGMLVLLAGFAFRCALLLRKQQEFQATAKVSFPVAVCGNGVIESGEDCELDQAGCPADCIRRP